MELLPGPLLASAGQAYSPPHLTADSLHPECSSGTGELIYFKRKIESTVFFNSLSTLGVAAISLALTSAKNRVYSRLSFMRWQHWPVALRHYCWCWLLANGQVKKLAINNDDSGPAC